MNDDNYLTINEQGLAEINPTASSNMQNAFIDAYRNIQGENTAQIGTQAHALGSDLEAQYGGLHGPSEYMKSRYQTPQTESRLAGLRAASQLSALNQLMQNDIANYKDKYSQAYRNYNKRQRAKQNALYGGNGGGSSGSQGGNSQPDIVTNVLEEKDVVEDAFFKRQEQENLYNQLLEEQAAARGISVDEYKQLLSNENKVENAANPVSVTGGIGAYDFNTKTFNSGL